MNRVGTHTVETPRLTLRKITMDDAEEMFRNWASDDEVTKHLTWKSHTSIDSVKEIIALWLEELKRGDCFRWCIVYKETGELIGSIDVVELHPHLDCAAIGYCMARRYWGKGIMTEALKAVTGYLFSKADLNRVEAMHYVENPASGEVMKKSGMVYEGILRQRARDNNNSLRDVSMYAVLRSDWEKRG